jgi:3-demethoxyubiquinol 3-hydroxylase
MSLIDRAIGEFDRTLRALAGIHQSERPNPSADVADAALNEGERRHAAGLMRVNHVGEICAQALYQGQALTARDSQAREALEQAAHEEEDHLAWSAERIRELDGRTSLLNPVWYGGSFAIGLAAGALGDRWNLAFLAETERQVEEHLSGHLEKLPPADQRTRVLVEAMRADEARHRDTALGLGAAELPAPVKLAMRLASRIMTTVSYRL